MLAPLCGHDPAHLRRDGYRLRCGDCGSFFDRDAALREFRYDASYPEERDHFDPEVGALKIRSLERWLGALGVDPTGHVVCEVGFGGGRCLPMARRARRVRPRGSSLSRPISRMPSPRLAGRAVVRSVPRPAATAARRCGSSRTASSISPNPTASSAGSRGAPPPARACSSSLPRPARRPSAGSARSGRTGCRITASTVAPRPRGALRRARLPERRGLPPDQERVARDGRRHLAHRFPALRPMARAARGLRGARLDFNLGEMGVLFKGSA